MKNFLLSVIFFLCAHCTVHSQPRTFTYTGAPETYTVPACVYAITVDLKGAAGGVATSSASTGGKGGRVQATVPVTPGSVLTVNVGGAGAANAAGWNGGGLGGAVNAGGGGGASDVRRDGTALSNRIVVAAGGGGTGFCSTCTGNTTGGPGGGRIGGAGWYTTQGSASTGKGGTQEEGGEAGSEANIGTAGELGNGGHGGGNYGGGGGGGYYGGGGGATNICCWSGGGGGGSNYAIPSATDTIHSRGIQSGNGQIIITPVLGTPKPGTIAGNKQVTVHAEEAYSITAVPGASTYTWTVPSGWLITSGAGTDSIVATVGDSSGNITITAEGACGTSAPTSSAVTVSEVSRVVDVTSTNNARLTIYPTSVTDVLHLSLESSLRGPIRIEIVDMMGRLVTELHDAEFNERDAYTIDMKSIPTGFYAARVVQGTTVVSKFFHVTR